VSTDDQTPVGQPRKGEARTAWDDEGSIVDRLKTAPTDASDSEGEPALSATGARAGTDGGGPAPSSARSTRRADAREIAHPHGTNDAGTRGVQVDPGHEYHLDPAAEKRAERQVTACFLVAGLAGFAFVLVYFLVDIDFRTALPGLPVTHTVLLGILLGVSLLAIGAGPVIWAKKLMPHEEAVQEREPFASRPEDQEATLAVLAQGLQDAGLPRRKMLLASLGFGGLGLGLAGAVPLVGIGPYRGNEIEVELRTTAFAPGVRLVRENGAPVRIGDLNIGAILTVFPETDTHDYDSPTMLIRMRPEEFKPVPGREDWSIDGYVAYSKICTHLGCPVSLYQQVTHQLLCPCHQSTFLASEGARVIFGPAARALPQLALALDEDGYFIARGDYTEPVGPSYWSRG
jgi:ubiquinol-cytochrome c reductase iron-sulfur subunit